MVYELILLPFLSFSIYKVRFKKIFEKKIAKNFFLSNFIIILQAFIQFIIVELMVKRMAEKFIIYIYLRFKN